MRTLINNSPDAQLVIDVAGFVIFLNPAAQNLFGLHDLDSSAFRLPLAEDDGPTQLCIPGDPNRTVEMRSNPVVLHDESVRLISLRDVTEQMRLESIKQDMENISRHDLKSPLSGIVGLARAMQAKSSADKEHERVFGMIADSGEQVLEQVNRTLDLYKMETGSYTLHPERVDLAEILHEKIKRLPKRPDAAGVELKGFEDGFVVSGEPMLLHMLVDNLLNNALDASGGKPVIVEADREASLVVFWNALEVPRDIRNVFFEKYVTQGKRFGTGLGTYSAKLVAQTHGAEISMKSSKADGTTIALDFSNASPP